MTDVIDIRLNTPLLNHQTKIILFLKTLNAQFSSAWQ